MKKIFVRKSKSGLLAPADAHAEQVISRWRDGDAYSLTYHRARNIRFHRLAFAIADLVTANAPDGAYWSGKDAYHFIKAVELSHGIVEECVDCSGHVYMVPKSIAFENMDDDEFQKVYDALTAEASRVLGVHVDDLKAEVENDL